MPRGWSARFEVLAAKWRRRRLRYLRGKNHTFDPSFPRGLPILNALEAPWKHGDEFASLLSF
jgi:hypothetical protein